MSEPTGRLVLILASANKDKATEMKEILSSELASLVELRDRPLRLPEVEETGETLEENARLKAVAIKDATGLGAIADDTGLEVLALGGRPGVRTARFAGPAGRADDNIALLLAELADSTDRRARFHTIALAAMADGAELVAAGMLEGTIARRPRGSGGF
ncbi:MAG TPA: non-canonical purine NTP pyrophosphatase, partial [Acidimicrobiales bacterium]|nr:non-canonical purine NTP pyrophosphatase [Acidimicrobiales bacterium]